MKKSILQKTIETCESNHKPSTNNYLPCNVSDRNYLPSCTSVGYILQMCKGSSVLVHPFRKSRTYDWDIWTDEQTGSFLYTPQILIASGITTDVSHVLAVFNAVDVSFYLQLTIIFPQIINYIKQEKQILKSTFNSIYLSLSRLLEKCVLQNIHDLLSFFVTCY